jgi:hypothetical protein
MNWDLDQEITLFTSEIQSRDREKIGHFMRLALEEAYLQGTNDGFEEGYYLGRKLVLWFFRALLAGFVIGFGVVGWITILG